MQEYSRILIEELREALQDLDDFCLDTKSLIRRSVLSKLRKVY